MRSTKHELRDHCRKREERKMVKKLANIDANRTKPSVSVASWLLLESTDGHIQTVPPGITDCPKGCFVKADGKCKHGYLSAARTLGLTDYSF